MNVYPALTDALAAEYRGDKQDRNHWPATVVAPNGSLICTTDYSLCASLAREVIEAQWYLP